MAQSNHLFSRFSVLTRLLALLCVNLAFLAPAYADEASKTTVAQTAKSSSTEDSDINRFVNTIDIIKKEYALPVDEKKLLEDAIRGMVANLDPHSEYLDENEYRSLLTSTRGEFGGLGIEIMGEYGVLKVVTPIDGTPAFRAGIKAGDYIVALNGKLVNQMTPTQAVAEMRGAKGTQILVTILRKGIKEPIKFSIIRDLIKVENLKSRILTDNIGYVRISQFQQPTGDELKAAVLRLQKQTTDNKLKGLILDLRNNPGGLLDSAVDVANLFLESEKLAQFDKLIVYTEGRVTDSQYKANATGQDILAGAPLIILINEGSASASEIVAGALQDYRRAIIVGNTSFGKGSVQTVLPLDNDHAVKLTTSLYHTPSGRLIQNLGITPDIFIDDIKIAEQKEAYSDPIREMELRDHISNPDMVGEPVLKSAKLDLTALAKEDFQLYQSLNILQAMSLTTAKMAPKPQVENPKIAKAP